MKSRKCEPLLLFVGLGFWASICIGFSLNSFKGLWSTPKQSMHEVSTNLSISMVAAKMFMVSFTKICNKNINKQIYKKNIPLNKLVRMNNVS